MPPLTCPHPGPRMPGWDNPEHPDCPLYAYRLSMPGQQLRRAVLADSREARPTLADAVKADAAELTSAEAMRRLATNRPPLPKPVEQVVIPVRRIEKGTTR